MPASNAPAACSPRARLLSPDGTAAPVGVVLTPDPSAPQLRSAATRIAVARGGRVTVLVRCPAARRCSGRVELRLGTRRATASVPLRGKAGRLVRVPLTLTPDAARTVAARRTTTVSLRATWGFPAQAKAVDLTLFRGAQS
ncbi:MAG: hypothetical protein PGN13_15375 [Patulibacter minatonensis]